MEIQTPYEEQKNLTCAAAETAIQFSFDGVARSG